MTRAIIPPRREIFLKGGGKIIIPKMAIGEYGFIGHFEDTEGNRIGLHSMK
jgi:predicted enzyme related to lactoylglutathione lyase